MRLNLRADRALVRAGARSRRFVCAEIQAPFAPSRPGRIPVNIAFVLDRSGSMDGEKIARARAAVLQGIHSLHDEDRFAVVAYDDQVETVVPSAFAVPAAREAAAARVAGIESRGSTDLEGGWRRGCDEVVEQLSTDAVGRCLLLTDGLANAGVTDQAEIVRRAGEWRSRSVVTSAFGVGAGFDETLLRRMADAGGGNFEFIETASQIADFVASELGEALAITAREAVLVVEAGEGVEVESLNDYPCRLANGSWRVSLGSLFSGQALNPILRVTIPEDTPGVVREVRVRLEDADGALRSLSASLAFTAASHGENDRQPRDRSIDRRVAALYAARAERDALERNRERDFGGARQVLERCLRRTRQYAGDDTVLQQIVLDLQSKVERYGRDMDDFTRKGLYSTSHRSMKERWLARERQRALGVAPVTLLGPERLRGVIEPVLAPLASADPDLLGNLSFERVRLPDGSRALPLGPQEERRRLEDALRASPDDGIRVLFTGRRLLDNWFSHWHDDCRAAVVSLADWDGGFRVPVEAFVAYEVVQHGLRALGPAWAPERLAHDETRGCLFDFCAHREDVEIKLQAADFCPSCRAALTAARLPLDRLLRLAEVIRTLAAPAGVLH